jgi:hypothetical protein
MTNKIFRFRTLFLVVAGTLSWLSANSQTGSTSPYSRYGIGDIVSEGFANQAGMGGLGAGLSSPFNINFSNPASYIADSSVVFEVGARGEVRQLEKNGSTTTLNSSSFSYLSLAFPIVKGKVGVAFGVLPISSVGYDIVVDDYDVTDIGHVRYRYEGDGGFNKFFVGTGVKILKNLNAGLNVSYLFGTIDNVKSVEFPSGTNYFNSRYIDAVTANGFTFDYGLIYEKPLKNEYVFRAGFTGSVSSEVNASNSTYYYNYTISPFGGEIVKDSVFNETEIKGKVKLPQYWRGGVSLEKPDKWMIGADFTYNNWKNFESFKSKDTLKNGYSAIIGGQKFTNRFDYRMGFRYSNSFLNLKETRLNDYALTLGLGIKKLLPKRPPSAINIAVEFGQRGTLENDLIKEQYVKFHLGFTLTDIWFIQPKYD